MDQPIDRQPLSRHAQTVALISSHFNGKMYSIYRAAKIGVWMSTTKWQRLIDGSTFLSKGEDDTINHSIASMLQTRGIVHEAWIDLYDTAWVFEMFSLLCERLTGCTIKESEGDYLICKDTVVLASLPKRA